MNGWAKSIQKNESPKKSRHKQTKEREAKENEQEKNKVLKAKSIKCKKERKETADFGLGSNRKKLQED